MLLLLVTACDPGQVDLDSGDGKDSGPQAPKLSLDAPGAFDPMLGGPLTATATSAAGTPTLTLTAPDGTVITTGEGSLAWDGHDGTAWAAPGAYTLEATVVDADSGLSTTETAEIALVRVGIGYATTDDDDAEEGCGRVLMYWHKSKTLQDDDDPFAFIPSLDDGTSITPFPPLADDLETLDESRTQPLAYPYDCRPTLRLMPGESTAFPDSGLSGADIEVAIEGWTVLEGNPLRDGTPVVLQKDQGLADGPGVDEGELEVQFRAEGQTFATQAVPYRAYALLDQPTWDASGPQYTSWVAAVDPALRGIDGVTGDQAAVLDALVEWIYRDSGLSYDTKAGASAYTYYTHGWNGAEFDFTSFLDRASGTIVNCTDCASILLTYANMLGARLNYTIILQNFSLNQIKAIGGDEFSNCPFGSWGCGFSYHAVTTNDEAETIWDVTLALDGDDDPGALPSEELLVQSIAGEEYLDRLVMSGNARYQYNDQGTIK